MKELLLTNQKNYQTMQINIQKEIQDYLIIIIAEELSFVENDDSQIINFWNELKLFNNDCYQILIRKIENSVNDFITYEINKQLLLTEIIDSLRNYIVEQSLLINYQYEFRKTLLEERLFEKIYNYIIIYRNESKQLYK